MQTESDGGGRYQLVLVPGEYVLTYHSANHDDVVIDLAIYDDGVLNIDLQPSPIILDEVVISDQVTLNKAIGQTSLIMSQIRRSPAFLGEIDLIKQVQSQPGVTTVGEVASGFNVRGGGVDQNLVLYDDVPVFNTSHALGFFTAFNSDAIGEASFYRGGIPAQYGGRASSVLNIVSREGDPKKWTGTGGIGIISSHLTLGGPIKKDTTSLIVSLRSSYSDWMLNVIKSDYEDLKNSSLKFYDGSVKLSHKLTDKSKLTLSGYASSDAASLASDTTFYWSNAAVSLRYDHVFSNKLFSSVSLSYGEYRFRLRDRDAPTAFDLASSISYPSLKFDFQTDGQHKFSFGFQNTYYEFDPGRLKPISDESNVRNIKMKTEQSLESALYFSDAFYLSEKLLVEAGLRYSLFNNLGPSTVYRYKAGVSREIENIEDSTVYQHMQISNTYHGIEPRVSLRYSINENSSVKVGYNRMFQYMHLITNTAAVTPTDIWQSANTYFKPQIADQLSAGIFKNYHDNMFETFAEIYYKKVENVLDFRDGADLILNNHLETALIIGVGNSYGAEFSVSKIKGRLLGSVNYTYSRSLRKSEGGTNTEQINRGETYPSNYDQPHVVNLNWRYGISRRLFFSGNFVYHTGRPVSLPTSGYSIDGVPVSNFSDRNQYRIPDYHRLDVAMIVEGNHKLKKFWAGNWVISFYNVYGRKNAYSVFFVDNGKGVLKPYKLSVVGTMIPSISYSFKF
jgi:hypothetical protein